MEISEAIMAVYNDLMTWKDECDHDAPTLMEHDLFQCQIESTAIRLWCNHAIILLLSTEDSEANLTRIMEGVAQESIILICDMDSSVKSFFRYEEYVMGWPFRRSRLLRKIGLI